MKEYIPPYPVLSSSKMRPRDHIRLVPESNLKPFERAEINNLRRGVGYKIVAADTPENRESVNIIAMYYQLVAHKEGWTFDPNLYQVEFLSPGNPRLGPEGYQSRVWKFKDGSTPPVRGLPIHLSPNNHLGFQIHEETGAIRVMDDTESDGLVAKVIKLFH